MPQVTGILAADSWQQFAGQEGAWSHTQRRFYSIDQRFLKMYPWRISLQTMNNAAMNTPYSFNFLKKFVLCFTKVGWWNSRADFLQSLPLIKAFMVAVAMAMFLRRTSYPNTPRVQWVRGCDEHCWHFPLRPRSRVKNLVVGTLSMGCLTKNSLRIASHFEKDGELLARGACWKVQILSNQMYSSLMMSLRQVHHNKYCNQTRPKLSMVPTLHGNAQRWWVVVAPVVLY